MGQLVGYARCSTDEQGLTARCPPNCEDRLRRSVVEARPDWARAVYQLNRSAERHEIRSRLAQRLESTAWVLDRDGNLRTPARATEEDLAPGLSMPAQEPSLLSEVGFGRDAVRAAARRNERDIQAEAFGLPSADVAEQFGRWWHEDPESAARFLAEREPQDFPEGVSEDPERRARIAGADALGAPERRYAKRERQIALDEQKSRAKRYLTENYTTSDSVMVCQACHQEMPFKVNDAYYFEAVQFIRGRRRDHHQNRLALCPLCAAKYQHAKESDDETLLEDILTAPLTAGAPWLDIPVMLAGESAALRFTSKHAIDLRAALEVAGEERAESD